jgi:RNA polymerase sigma-70 factor (ECF subfamily)
MNCVTVTDSLTGYLLAIAIMSWTHAAGANETDLLLCDAARGDAEAIRSLLERHRTRLRRMISLRLDSHLAARVDASDVVQEALLDAARKLGEYARERPLPFYAWLHRLAAERVADAHRRHWRCASRSVRREEVMATTRPDVSARILADRLVVTDPTPGHILIRQESQEQVHAALARLAPSDRDVLVLRYLEDLSFPEIAAILGIGEGAAKMRHLRALQRMRTHIECDGSGSTP